MDILKVFVDEPAPLEGLAHTSDPPETSLDDWMTSLRTATGYGRAYLAGTRLPDRPSDALRIGLTALDHAETFTRPLLAWAAGRTWTRLSLDGTATGLIAPEAANSLQHPTDTAALALADGPIAADLLHGATASGRDGIAALRAALDADASLAVFVPTSAHDGHDWSVVARSPLRETLVTALRAAPSLPNTRRFVVPHRKARGEHTFYFEQWSLDAPPAGTEEIV